MGRKNINIDILRVQKIRACEVLTRRANTMTEVVNFIRRGTDLMGEINAASFE